MQSASKSPIFSHFSESQSGVATIRAYGVQEKFIKQMEDHIDESFVHSYAITVSNRWLALRLEIIGNLITIFAAFFAIFARSTLSAGLAGLFQQKKILILIDITNKNNVFRSIYFNIFKCKFKILVKAKKKIYFIISVKISSTLNWFVRAVSEFEANITSVERIKEYFDIKQEVKSKQYNFE